MNVGEATLKDLQLLGITNVKQLQQANPYHLYQAIQQITGKKHDPYVWDVFAAIIHEAQTGKKTPWWHWTPLRKKRRIQSQTIKKDLLTLQT